MSEIARAMPQHAASSDTVRSSANPTCNVSPCNKHATCMPLLKLLESGVNATPEAWRTARWQKSRKCCGMPFWKLSGRNWSIDFVFVYCGYFSTASSQFSKASWDRNACWMFRLFFIIAHSFPISGSDHSPFTTFISKLTIVSSSKLRSGRKLIPLQSSCTFPMPCLLLEITCDFIFPFSYSSNNWSRTRYACWGRLARKKIVASSNCRTYITKIISPMPVITAVGLGRRISIDCWCMYKSEQ